MFKKIIAPLLLMLSIWIPVTVQAGGIAIPINFSIAGDCNSVTVQITVKSPGTFTLTDVTAGQVLDTRNLGSIGTYSFVVPLDPPLEDSTVIEAEMWGVIRTLNVSCEQQVELCLDGRLNSNACEPVAIYPVVSDDGVGIIIYETSRGDEIYEFMLYISAEDFATLTLPPEETCVVDASGDGFVNVYLLDTGEIQINVGPDDENKVFELIFSDLFSEPTVTTFIGGGSPPEFPVCD